MSNAYAELAAGNSHPLHYGSRDSIMEPLIDATLTNQELAELFAHLEYVFKLHPEYHQECQDFDQVVTRMRESTVEDLWSVYQMFKTEGDPAFIKFEKERALIMDTSEQSPLGRRDQIYNTQALPNYRLMHPEVMITKRVVLAVSQAMGVNPLDRKKYRFLQSLGKFDVDGKSDSWIYLPNAHEEGLVGYRDNEGAQFMNHQPTHITSPTRGWRGYKLV